MRGAELNCEVQAAEQYPGKLRHALAGKITAVDKRVEALLVSLGSERLFLAWGALTGAFPYHP